MLMINALRTRRRQQHVNKATGELPWKRGVQRSLDARRGRDVEERLQDKTDDCCLFVVAAFPLSNSSLYPFTPYRYPFLPSLHSLTPFFPPFSPSLYLSPSECVCVCVCMAHFILQLRKCALISRKGYGCHIGMRRKILSSPSSTPQVPSPSLNLPIHSFLSLSLLLLARSHSLFPHNLVSKT